ncbi:MAG: hydroxyacid dehydrogenase [Alphaproteobacteria bacterium]|nr:hydroxyacid dehydrogenase [Alphaproteobacteria bacterium]
MGYNVLITAPKIAQEGIDMLKARGANYILIKDYPTEDELVDLVVKNKIDAIILSVGQISARVIDAATNLRVISKHGIGVDNADVAHATAKGIPVVNGRNSNSQSVAEHALGMIIAQFKDFRRLDRVTRGETWEKTSFRGIELAGKHVGVIGFGGNGRRFARLLKAFGVKVSVYDPYLKDAVFAEEGVIRVASVEDFISDVDVVSIHAPRTSESYHMFDAALIGKMKPTAYLNNPARGGIIDEDALYEALRDNKIAGAALDVFETEPPAKDHPLFSLENIMVSPHIAGITNEAMTRMATMAVENVYSVLDETPLDPECSINPETLPKGCRVD